MKLTKRMTELQYQRHMLENYLEGMQSLTSTEKETDIVIHYHMLSGTTLRLSKIYDELMTEYIIYKLNNPNEEVQNDTR